MHYLLPTIFKKIQFKPKVNQKVKTTLKLPVTIQVLIFLRPIFINLHLSKAIKDLRAMDLSQKFRNHSPTYSRSLTPPMIG